MGLQVLLEVVAHINISPCLFYFWSHSFPAFHSSSPLKCILGWQSQLCSNQEDTMLNPVLFQQKMCLSSSDRTSFCEIKHNDDSTNRCCMSYFSPSASFLSLFLHLKKWRRKTWHNFVRINQQYQCSFVELRFLIPGVLGFLLLITYKHSVWCVLEFCCFHKKLYQLNTAK